jgi:hypothetical protein
MAQSGNPLAGSRSPKTSASTPPPPPPPPPPGSSTPPQIHVDANSAGLTPEGLRMHYADTIPLGRIGQPDETASAVTLLTAPRIGSAVGQTVQINGGSTRCHT